MIGESAGIIETSGAGVTFEPESSEGLLEVLHQFHSEHELYEMMSKRGQESAKNFNRAILADRMLVILRGVHAASQAPG